MPGGGEPDGDEPSPGGLGWEEEPQVEAISSTELIAMLRLPNGVRQFIFEILLIQDEGLITLKV